MADAALGVLFQDLNSLIQREFGLLWGVQKDMEKLSSTLSTIRAVLEDAEAKQVKSKAIKAWLGKLKDVAYDADDVVDEWSTDQYTLQTQPSIDSSLNCICDQVHCSSSSSSCFDVRRLVFRYKIAKKIKQITRKLDGITKEMNDFNLIEMNVERGVTEFNRSRVTSSVLYEPKVYGREVDKEKIVSFLLDNLNCRNDVCVCPIIGIGGLGKTTLAQYVYNDERVGEYFDKKMWVCVSEDFGVERLTKMIIESFSEKSCDLPSLDTMQCQLREMLKEKRFLLVLDDVWNENQDVWHRLKSSLLFGAKGSSIIVTTRLQTVASIMGTIPAYELSLLSQDDCWNLFRHHAFGMGNEEKPNLANIGQEIVRKCGGVPLAAKALGSMLRFKSDEREWMLVRDSEIWDLERDEKNIILPALRLSYNNLSMQLRQCFAYCSIFPKDYEMNKIQIVHLWIANGLIQSDRNMELEDIGDGIFKELVWRSLFQDIKEDDLLSTITCKMHDLLHDLGSSVLIDECLRIEVVQFDNIRKKVRHLTLLDTQSVPSGLDQLLLSQASLRTIFFPFSHQIEIPQPCLFIIFQLKCLRVLNLRYVNIKALPPWIDNLKHLRYLDLTGCSLKSLPNSIGCLRNLQMLCLGQNGLITLPPSMAKLEQLRYINLSSNPFTSLPESICSLTNLRTLNIKWCLRLEGWPKLMIKSMGNLKHLLNECCAGLSVMPIGIGKLTRLETLNCFVASLEDGRGANIEELQGLSLLRGKLQITKLERVGNSMNIKEVSLINRDSLLSALTFSWTSGENPGTSSVNCLDVLEALQPHLNIRELKISGYPGVRFPRWMEMEMTYDSHQRLMFPQLIQISLIDLPNLEKLSWDCEVKHRFSSLQHLQIHNCPKLKTLPTALSSLTTLSTLSIKKCELLEMLPELGVQGLTSSLEHVSIDTCHALSSVSEGLKHLQSLRFLWIENCPKLEFPTECFEHLIALQHLTISMCPKLVSLPDGLKQSASSLKELNVFYCKNLIVLPDWMRDLKVLQELLIQDCHSDLIRRCEKDKGEYWHKIAHIPKATIR
ncbi:hypothetical protein Scep_029504 [Stephania cephalantha]|uniref:Disease resistance protein RGA3 n=1 Tax=Stephania cephalantha TaxID=152367 RepID=A0AAP0E5I1_9MAGN